MFRDLIDDLDDYSVEPDMLLDVPFVPTDEAVIEAMLNLVEVGPADLLYDLGSGDGRILVAAARDRDTRGIGVEIDPLRIADAFDYAAHTRVEYLVDFVEDSIFTADISDATVVTLYLLDSINVQLRPRLLRELRPGTRIISHAFDMGDWKADERLEFSGTKIYKWIVPAQVAGVWEWNGYDDTPYRVELQQKYQEITGRAWVADTPAELKSAALCGASLELTIQEGGATLPITFTLNFENNDLQSIVEDA
ncbi:class I SAM-dependent methyltransferase [Alcaligenaceae bacterium]|nr:class I SAM-dependent methyltransferase [Alcaligenaceae bacterium]